MEVKNSLTHVYEMQEVWKEQSWTTLLIFYVTSLAPEDICDLWCKASGISAHVIKSQLFGAQLSSPIS